MNTFNLFQVTHRILSMLRYDIIFHFKIFMVKIVILTGSPHQNGTSHQLADAFEKGARESGHDIYRFNAGLQGPSEPHFLQMDPNQKGEVGLRDNDLFETEVIPKLIECDVIVYVSSVYSFGMNAQLKTVIDRFYNYSNQMRNKKTVVLVTGYGTQKQLAAIKMHFEGMGEYYNWENVGSVYADDSWNENKFKTFIEKAYKIGKSIK